jgi:pyruvate ferredoxin oxidoreductase delta subunit
MYYVAETKVDKCSTYKCNQCVLFCPEPNTLMFLDQKNFAYVNQSRCKGCAICVYVCGDLLKRNCIEMVMAVVSE